MACPWWRTLFAHSASWNKPRLFPNPFTWFCTLHLAWLGNNDQVFPRRFLPRNTLYWYRSVRHSQTAHLALMSQRERAHQGFSSNKKRVPSSCPRLPSTWIPGRLVRCVLKLRHPEYLHDLCTLMKSLTSYSTSFHALSSHVVFISRTVVGTQFLHLCQEPAAILGCVSRSTSLQRSDQSSTLQHYSVPQASKAESKTQQKKRTHESPSESSRKFHKRYQSGQTESVREKPQDGHAHKSPSQPHKPLHQNPKRVTWTGWFYSVCKQAKKKKKGHINMSFVCCGCFLFLSNSFVLFCTLNWKSVLLESNRSSDVLLPT